jgi:hypothetical protein
LESLWAILKGFWKVAGKCPNTCCQPIGEQVECPAAIGKNVAIPCISSELLRFGLHLFKVEGAVENF